MDFICMTKTDDFLKAIEGHLLCQSIVHGKAWGYE